MRIPYNDRITTLNVTRTTSFPTKRSSRLHPATAFRFRISATIHARPSPAIARSALSRLRASPRHHAGRAAGAAKMHTDTAVSCKTAALCAAGID
jgi:hypothetical protein